MTLLNIKNDLYSYLLANQEFTVESFIKDSQIIADDIDIYKRYVLLIIDEFIKLDILRAVESPAGQTHYILTKGIQFYSQNVEISGATASFVAEIIGKFGEVLDADLSVDSLNINEKDIKLLVGICTDYFNLIKDKKIIND